MNKTKVLYLLKDFNIGGGEAFCAALVCNLPIDIQVDFAVESYQKTSPFYQALKAHGAKFYTYGHGNNSLLKIPALKAIIKAGSYDIVHAHRDYFNGGLLLAAKYWGIKKRISHAHLACDEQSGFLKKLYIKLQKAMIGFAGTDFWACSTPAGLTLYGKRDFKIINNGIDTQNFAFSPFARKEFRQKYNLQDKFVIGHVGRFVSAKNHSFLLDVFAAIYSNNNNAALLLAGTGPCAQEIEDKINVLNLKHAVHFWGLAPVAGAYQVMDAFVMPSLHEGFGIVALEAQCAGLPCFISNTIPHAAVVVNTIALPLTLHPSAWAAQIMQTIVGFNRADQSHKIAVAGFSMAAIAADIALLYRPKRVGILTFHRADNYGAVLQAYALQSALHNLGAASKIINYYCPHLEDAFAILKKGNIIKGIIKLPFELSRRIKFGSFRRKFFNTTKPVYNCDLYKLNEHFDMFVAGSDQVWNGSLCGYDKTYCLDFAKNTAAKAAYAASFGLANLDAKQAAFYKPLLGDFSYIAVRENQGSQIIKELINRDVPTVLDPTLLLDMPAWQKVAQLPKEDNYILIYLMTEDVKIINFAHKLAKKKGLKIIAISQKLRRAIGGKYISCTPQEFLGYFIKAKYIVTNSFHGTVFSINFNKQLFIDLLPKGMPVNSRLDNALDLFGLRGRLIDNADINADIDFTNVNAILAKERQKSIDYLKEIIKP